MCVTWSTCLNANTHHAARQCQTTSLSAAAAALLTSLPSCRIHQHTMDAVDSLAMDTSHGPSQDCVTSVTTIVTGKEIPDEDPVTSSDKMTLNVTAVTCHMMTNDMEDHARDVTHDVTPVTGDDVTEDVSEDQTG